MMRRAHGRSAQFEQVAGRCTTGRLLALPRGGLPDHLQDRGPRGAHFGDCPRQSTTGIRLIREAGSQLSLLLKSKQWMPLNDHSDSADRRSLRIAFLANVGMSVVGMVGWRVARSTTLLADACDMLADATGYAVAFWVVGRSLRHQRLAARWSVRHADGVGFGFGHRR